MAIGSQSFDFSSLRPALLGAMLLALRAGRRAVPIAVAAMLAAGIATAPAQAALYQFKFLFDEGPLAGNQYTGSFQTGSDTGPGIYYPDHLNPSYRLLTFDVTIGAVSFDKFDDVNPPGNPVVIIGNDLMNLMANRIDFHTADDAIPYLFIWLINSDEDFNIVSFRANASDDLSRGRIISITQGFDDFAIPPNSPEGQRLFDLLGPDGLRARFPIPVEANAVPAPASLILLGAGLSLLAAARRFRTNRRRPMRLASAMLSLGARKMRADPVFREQHRRRHHVPDPDHPAAIPRIGPTPSRDARRPAINSPRTL